MRPARPTWPLAAVLLAAVLLGASPGLPAHAAVDWDGRGPLPEGVVELSHAWWVPWMDAAALDIPHGIRPGAWLQLGNSYCTASFVVQDGAGNLYLTTAGHCTQAVGQRIAVKQGTAVAAAGQWLEFGTLVARWPGWLDAALIRIDADKVHLVDPTIPGWGGPQGVATARPADALHYGWGWVTWQEHQNRCRTAAVDSWGSSVWWIRTDTYGGGGDSGSAVMARDGMALGILNWARNVQPDHVGGAFYAKELGGLRFDVAIAALSAQTGLSLRLVTGGPVTVLDLPAPAPHDDCVPEPPVPAPPAPLLG
jgi:hypothetical protein